MSGNDNIERELESFLKEDESRVAALYRKLPRPEPDAKLDAAVLAMARNAVSHRHARRNWAPALSAAAVVVFAAGVAYRVGPQVWNDRGEMPRPSATQDVMEKKVAPAEPAAVPQPAASPTSPPVRDPESFPADAAVNMAKPKSAPVPQISGNAMSRQKTIAPVAKSLQQPRAAPMEIDKLRADKAAGTMAPVPPSPPVQSEPLQSLDSTIFPAKEEANHDSSSKATGGAGPPEPLSTMSATPAPVSAAAQPAPAPARKTQSAADPNANLYPEHWLDNIRKMLREKRSDEAIKSLGEFRKKYPNYALPDDLRDLK